MKLKAGRGSRRFFKQGKARNFHGFNLQRLNPTILIKRFCAKVSNHIFQALDPGSIPGLLYVFTVYLIFFKIKHFHLLCEIF